jgi:hypothetical protein
MLVTLAGVHALLAAGLMVTAPSAAADTKPVLALKPNQKITVNYETFVPAGVFVPYSLLFAYQPADCQDDGQAFAWCDTVPIRLLDNDGKPLSAKRLDSGLFALSIKLDWETETLVVPAGGNEPLTQLSMAVWDDPIVADEDAPASCDPNDAIYNFYLCTVLGPAGGNPGGDEDYYDSGFAFSDAPLNAGLIPRRNAYAATIALNSGAGVPWHLTVSLVETDASDLIDKSVDLLDDLSNTAADIAPVAAGVDLGGSSLPNLSGSGAGLDLGLAGVGADADLDSLSANADNLDLTPAAEEIIRGRNVRDVKPPGKASPLLLIIWLVVLPLAVLGGAGAWFRNRRASLFS